MSSAKAVTTEISQPRSSRPNGRTATAVAVATGLSVPPALPEAGERSIDEIPDRAVFQRWVDERRLGIATVIGAAVQVGYMAPEKAVSVLESNRPREIISLTEQTIVSLGERAASVVARYCPKQEEVGQLFLDLEENQINVYGQGFYFRLFNLQSMPLPLATATHAALMELAQISYGVSVDDLAEYCGWPAMMRDDIQGVKENGLMESPMADIQEWAEESTETLTGMDEEEFAETIQERRDWMEWAEPYDYDVIPARAEGASVGDWLLLLLWEWRKSSPGLYRSPLSRFIRLTASFSRAVHKRRASKGPTLSFAEFEEGFQPLDFSHILGFGEPWTGETVEYLETGMMETGEEFCMPLSLDGVAVPALIAKLDEMAIATGLFNLAQELCSNDCQ